MLHLIIAVSIVLASWFGGAPFSQIFSAFYLLWFVVVWALTLVLVRVLLYIRFTFFAWCVYVFAMFAAYMTAGTFMYYMNDMPTMTMTSNIPVKVELMKTFGVNNGNVRFTNLSDNPLNELEVKCTLMFDNGKPIDVLFQGGTGGFTQYAKGFGSIIRVVSPLDFKQYRSNPADMVCAPATAKFIESPTFDLTLKVQRNADLHTDFYVTNNGVVPVKHIQFQCVDNKGRSTEVTAYPAYSLNIRNDTTVGHGETEKFISTTMSWDFSDCFISNAIAG